MNELIIRAANDLVNSKYGIALTGAGISTESGIQDYRGPSGLWTLNPEAEKRAYKSYEDFMDNPERWWNNVLSPTEGNTFGLGKISQASPNAGHYILAELENMGIVKWTITQNVDSLHETAGTKNLLEYHGSMSKYRCLSCGKRYKSDEFDFKRLYEERKLPPKCPDCGGIIKTDGVFFGEPIPMDIARRSIEEASKCDLMLICGTSAVVYPFANLPRISRGRRNVTIIEINAEPTPLTMEGISDYLIQGQLGEILPEILEQVKNLVA
ncbi:MAG: NAD-dependent deacylase [Dehalococcoidales bacterium]|nr:NAD-dependent deacylase [Dehalococcoidales bacterium]